MGRARIFHRKVRQRTSFICLPLNGNNGRQILHAEGTKRSQMDHEGDQGRLNPTMPKAPEIKSKGKRRTRMANPNE